MLKTEQGMRLNRLNPNDPMKIWKEHEEHQKTSAASQSIATEISTELNTMIIAESTTRA